MTTKDQNRTQTPTRKRSSARRPVKEGQIEIQYTPAKPFNRNRFLLHLATVAAVVLALVFGMSIFFKTQQVTVSGTEKYTAWEIKEASGIEEGDALFGLSEAKITAKIRTKLPYVGDVRVGIKLPNTVNIEITELSVVYAVADSGGQWWLMDASGRIVDTADIATAKDHTHISGVQIQSSVVGEQAVAAEPMPAEDATTGTGPTVVTLPPVSAAEKLSAAVQLLTALEGSGVMGEVDSVDVSDPQSLQLSYDGRYQVSLGDTSRLDYKVSAMKASIQKMGEYQSGFLDVSFTIWQNEVGYRPFDEGSGVKN